MEKFCEDSMRKDDIEENLIQHEKIMEYKRLKRLEEIEEKNKKLDDMQREKYKIYEERQKLKREMENSKKALLERFDNAMKKSKKKNKEQILREVFEDDYDELYGTENNKTIRKTQSTGNLEVNKKNKTATDYNPKKGNIQKSNISDKRLKIRIF